MKNIEFYYDELIEMSNVRDASMFACSKGKGREIRSHADYIKWLNEERKILDEKEKEYLSNIIKPFRSRVTSIVKIYGYYDEHAFIRINVETICENHIFDSIDLPFFYPSSMYTGMEKGKRYTLEELEL